MSNKEKEHHLPVKRRPRLKKKNGRLILRVAWVNLKSIFKIIERKEIPEIKTGNPGSMNGLFPGLKPRKQPSDYITSCKKNTWYYL